MASPQRRAGLIKDSGIKAPRDFKGKSILAAQGAAETKWTPVFFQKNGVDPATVELRQVNSQVKVTLFKAKQADAIVGYTHGDLIVFANDPGIGWMVFADYGVNFLGTGLVTSENLIKERPQVVRAFVKAALKAHQFMFDRPEEAADISLKHFPTMQKSDLVAGIKAMRDPVFTDDTKKFGLGHISKEQFATTQAFLLEVGLMAKKVDDVTRFYDDSFLK